jgi:hypothetical protein
MKFPEIQRSPSIVMLHDIPIGAAGSAAKKTLRRKTRVEMLTASGALEKHHVAAINLYVGAAEVATAGCVQACGYGEGGGSSPTGAASAAHRRQLDRMGDSDRYRRARAALPRLYVAAFERIVLDNHPIGAVGTDMWPGINARFVSHNMRDLVRTCADAIHLEFVSELGGTESPRPQLLKTMAAFDRKVSTARVSDAIRASITPSATTLIVAGVVAQDIRRENAIAGDLVEFEGLPVEVREHWGMGWILAEGAAR